MIAYTDRRTRSELAKLPNGVFTSDGYLDSDGYTDEPVHLVVKVAEVDSLEYPEVARSFPRPNQVRPSTWPISLWPSWWPET